MHNRALRYRAFGPLLERLELVDMDLPATPGHRLRVAMSVVPVNPSDLIPVTGAYAHRIALPAIAGYEGVGVVIDAPTAYASWVGQRVLPLRGPGTWQCFVDCDPELAVVVPADIDDQTAARAYINPLAALLMLCRWPVRGRRVLLTGAGSTCANLLGLWARQQGAASVTGVYRSESRVARMRMHGVTPIPLDDRVSVERAAAAADITFDALGGPVATAVLEAMGAGRAFVGYGLLSGRPVTPSRVPRARYQRFHLRDELAAMTPAFWQRQFQSLWPRLRDAGLPAMQICALSNWQQAIAQAARPGGSKPAIDFGAGGRRR